VRQRPFPGTVTIVPRDEISPPTQTALRWSVPVILSVHCSERS
jgi:hypothetical protein